MTDYPNGVREAIGELRGELRAFRDEHRRHIETTEGLRSEVAEMKVTIGKIEVDGHHSIGLVKTLVFTAIGAIAGMFGGHVPLPGGH